MRLTGPPCPAWLEQPIAQSPFAHLGRYLRWCDVWHHLRERYLSFLAPMDSCASPKPSLCLWSYALVSGLCRLLSAPAGSRTFPTLSLRILPDVPGPLPRRLVSALTRFFLHDIGLPPVRTRSALNNTRAATSARSLFRGCSHSLYVQARRFARHPGRSYRSISYCERHLLIVCRQ